MRSQLASPELEGSVPARAAQVRYYYMDGVRAIAMLAGVIFHIGLGYNSTFHEAWPMADTQTSAVVDAACWLLHTFRMPLFFLISGFFSRYLFERYGLWGFLRNRARRILLPFLVFWPLTLAAIWGVFVHVAASMPVRTPVLRIVKETHEGLGGSAVEQFGLSTAHLWFLYYLWILAVLAVGARWCLPGCRVPRRALRSPVALVLGLPLVSGVTLLRLAMPYPTPESLVPAAWAVGFFGGFYVIGWALFGAQDVLDALRRLSPVFVVCSVLAFSFYYAALPEPAPYEEMLKKVGASPPLGAKQVAMVLASSTLVWHLTFLSLVAGRRFLDRRSAGVRYVADAAYWVYVIHLPIVFYAQAIFHMANWPVALELISMSVGVLGVCFASYAVLVRGTPVGWLLSGRRAAGRIRETGPTERAPRAFSAGPGNKQGPPGSPNARGRPTASQRELLDAVGGVAPGPSGYGGGGAARSGEKPDCTKSVRVVQRRTRAR